ncbi:HlyD family secretion protein [Methylobacterium sp. JK268]
MTTPLFRQEAIDHQRAKIWGAVTLAVPLPLTLVTAFLVLCTVGLVTFVATGSYARKEHASGYLAPRLGVAAVVASRPGTITAVHVEEGQVVEKDAPLLTVTVEQSGEHGGGIDTAVLANLREQREHLEDQIGLERRRMAAEINRLSTDISGLGGELVAFERERGVQAARTAIAHDQVDSIAELVRKGTVSQLEYGRRQDAYLAAQQAELTLVRTIAEKQRELGQRRSALAQQPIDSERQIRQLEAQISDIDTRIRQTEGQRAYLITAAKRGRISALQAWIGKVADTVHPQMSIVPEGDVLTAEIFVPARAIGFVSPGQSVNLSYASFPARQFGFARGRIESVSYTLLKPEEMVGPATLRGPAYRVSVALPRQTILAYGRQIPLQADMQLDAEVILDRRSLVDWVLDPIRAAWRRA